MMKKLAIIIYFFIISFSPCLYAIEDNSFQAGKNYIEMENTSTMYPTQPKDIEVLVYLWYGCGGCYVLEPYVVNWAKTAPKNVKFQIIPAVFGGIWDVHGKIMLTLDEMGVDPNRHNDVFEAVQVKRIPLSNIEQIKLFIQKQGIDANEFAKIYQSQKIADKVEHIKKVSATYHLRAVPAAVINGKYRFDLSNVSSVNDFLSQIDYLVEKVSHE